MSGKGSARRQENFRKVQDNWPFPDKPIKTFGNFHMCEVCYKPVLNGLKCPRCNTEIKTDLGNINVHNVLSALYIGY